ncbi:DUF2061 domain-containing protein [Litoreibacter janthinus]|uniref:Uncharacterized membrane protein n=1 Tax=Litoreibacter janthinus TaxID=670154 RepID=A0A1I6HR70_9RHOB|nr:DUF2061 domain-containing protein [Litoreibacter janthinus]SFR56867.1 Uncharacterized membrane protein [Litoreibacter janthinus]
MESTTRSLVKAMLWTLLGFVMMSGVGYASTGSWALGGGMALANSTLGLVSYVLYERVWARISWGVAGPERRDV